MAKRPSEHRVSPPRVGATKPEGVNPEKSTDERTIELATDQSIAARHLLYHPNEASLAVVSRCADGVDSVMGRLDHTDDADENLAKDEILVSMVTRLMASSERIIGLNDKLAELVEMRKLTPIPDGYAEKVRLLADTCRTNMSEITTSAKKPGPEGALARQGLLAFMGDLGGLEKGETGYGAGFKGPLCDPKLVYDTYAAGLCDAQCKLKGQGVPASAEEVTNFEKSLDNARKDTSLKGGVLSAPAHTKAKKEERITVSFAPNKRRGLLNTGDLAEERLKEADPEHQKTLRDAAWPTTVMHSQAIVHVVEPVTGHVSGTFGEMVVTMNMFCGTPPDSMSRENPAGTPSPLAGKDQVPAITALAASGLITGGFHSAVEVFQPMSTFGTQATHGSLGPAAVIQTEKHSDALLAYAEHLHNSGKRLERFEHKGYSLDDSELKLGIKKLKHKAASLHAAATKSVDMISLLQGEGGTIATLEVCRVMANHSTDPKVPAKLYSLNTRLEELGQRGYTEELGDARNLTGLVGLPFANNDLLELSIKAAELAADSKDLHVAAAKANTTASELETRADTLTAASAEKNTVLQAAKTAVRDAQTAGKERGILRSLLDVESRAYNASVAARAEASAARAEATAARAEATAIDTKIAAVAEEIAAVAEQRELVQSVAVEKQAGDTHDLDKARDLTSSFKEAVAKHPGEDDSPRPSNTTP